jgi:hypothetical protein
MRKIPLALGSVLGIPPIDPRDYHIDITFGTVELLQIGHLNLLQMPALGHQLLIGEGNSMINLLQMDSPQGLGGSRSGSAVDDLSHQQGTLAHADLSAAPAGSAQIAILHRDAGRLRAV